MRWARSLALGALLYSPSLVLGAGDASSVGTGAKNASAKAKAERVGPAQQRTDSLIIGVLPFASASVDTALQPLAFAIADLLVADLAVVSRVTLVERARLGEVLREGALARSAAFDPTTAPRAGRLLGANRLVFGTLAGRGGQLVFEARLANVPLGTVDTAVRAQANLNDILAAQNELAFRLFARLGITLTPAERSEIEQRPTRNLAALLAYGRGVEQELNGNFLAARRHYRQAATADPNFREAEVRWREVGIRAIRTETSLVGGVVDRINPGAMRVPRMALPGLPGDPSYPVAIGIIVITISRP